MKRKFCTIGKVVLGPGYPVAVQTMLKTEYRRVSLLTREIRAIKKAGCEILRMAVEKKEDSEFVGFVKEKSGLPLEADIHFDWRLALLAIKEGADGVRLNPMNIKSMRKVREIAKRAKAKNVSIRVGINSGGFRKAYKPQQLARLMVEKVADYVEVLEKEKFFNLMLSFKAADIPTTLTANRQARKNFPYPLHIGITATGPQQEGLIKSSIGLGILLREGIGETLRVSLNAPAWQEVEVAKVILQSLGQRQFLPEVISCPTCSRCKVDLRREVERFKKRLRSLSLNRQAKTLKFALMGCVVNGPGEASQADLGLAFGWRQAAVFEKGKVICRWPARGSIEKFLVLIKERYGEKKN